MNRKRLRVCVCTSLQAIQEPRAPRHAAALASLGRKFEVVFVDCAPTGTIRNPVIAIDGFFNLTWYTHYFATRARNSIKVLTHRAGQRLGQLIFQSGGPVLAAALSTRAIGLENVLYEAGADIYLAHNIETLLPAYGAAQRLGALLMFDSMEFHSDMGDQQTAVERELVRAVEKKCLPACALVLASSDQLADALVKEYDITRPLPLYNTAPITTELPDKQESGLHLYWRNAVVGLSQRGLDDAFVALTKLPDDVILHLQGRLPADGGIEVRKRIAELGLTIRIMFHDPYLPEQAVQAAARYHVGLCLERKGVRNHELTVSNKIFDYHMAGLAVIASDLPGLHNVMERSQGGMVFTPGSAEDLAEKVMSLYRDREKLKMYANNAREFALREANREADVAKFTAAFLEIGAKQRGSKLY